MNPGIYNMQIEQGSTYTRAFVISDTDLDLSVYDLVRMSIRAIPGNMLAWDSEGTLPGGSITINGTDTIDLIIDAATTAKFEFDSANYDIELVKNETPEYVDKIVKGKIILNKETA